MTDLPVRVAGPDDAATLAQMLHDFNTEFDAWTRPVEEFAGRLRRLLAREDVRAWFAEPRGGGAPVGFALVTVRPSAYFDGGTGVLDELYVVPTLRDHGHGGALMEVVLSWCEERGIGELHINVDESDVDTRRFYERLGFSNFESSGEPDRMLLYVRDV